MCGINPLGIGAFIDFAPASFQLNPYMRWVARLPTNLRLLLNKSQPTMSPERPDIAVGEDLRLRLIAMVIEEP
jgi:hypothetical protein